jgi:hypothetical protein
MTGGTAHLVLPGKGRDRADGIVDQEGKGHDRQADGQVCFSHGMMWFLSFNCDVRCFSATEAPKHKISQKRNCYIVCFVYFRVLVFLWHDQNPVQGNTVMDVW